MSFHISYRLGGDDIRRLERISQIDGNLQVLRMNPEWAALLEREARLREAVSSIGVEGTVIPLDQAKAITTGKSTPRVSEKERREFLSYYDSLEFIKQRSQDRLTLQFLLAIHERITRGDPQALPGQIRVRQNTVRRHGRIVFTPPPIQQLPFLIREFLQWFNSAADDKDVSPIIAAAIYHFWFVWIHPFTDGNGRVARILTTLLLLKKKSEGIRYFALSDYYNRHQNEYSSILKRTNKCNPNVPAMNFIRTLSPWLSFFIFSFLIQAERVREVTNRILQINIRVEHLRKEGLITQRQNEALRLLYSQEKASYEELKRHLRGISLGRVHQILKPLRKVGILTEQRIGKRIWFGLGSPEGEPDETIFKKKLKRSYRRKAGKNWLKQAVLPIFDL